MTPLAAREDGLGGAVVLLELDDGRVRKRLLEVEHVPNVGSAKRVDRVVGEKAAGDEVVRDLDVQVVHGGVEVDPLGPIDDVIGPVLREHDHAGPHGDGRDPESMKLDESVGRVPKCRRGRPWGRQRDRCAGVAPLLGPALPARREVDVLGRAHHAAAAACRHDHALRSARPVCAHHPGRAQVAAAVAREDHLPLADLFDRLRRAISHRHLRAGHQALVVIAHHAQVPVLLAQQLQPAVLGAVRVLVLVHQHVPERAAVAVAHVGEELEQVHAAEQQVVEVHRVRGVQARLVQVVHVGGGLLEEAPHLQPIGLGVQERVLRLRDLVADPARREALRVDVELLDAVLDQPQRVLLVVDREPARVAEPLGVRAKHARAGRVERHHPHRPRPASHEPLHPLAHLLGGLVGERDREDLARGSLARSHQVRDPVRQHARLARAGASQDQQGPLAVQDGLALRLVQPLKQGLGGDRCAHPREDRWGGGGPSGQES